MERAWYAITETCLAFTVFRDDFNPKFVALFTLLLFLKSFHWLAEDRVDYVSGCKSFIFLDFILQIIYDLYYFICDKRWCMTLSNSMNNNDSPFYLADNYYL